MSASVTNGGRIRRRDKAVNLCWMGILEHRRFGHAEANPNNGGPGRDGSARASPYSMEPSHGFEACDRDTTKQTCVPARLEDRL